MLVLFLLVCIVCIIMQQVQLWRIRRSIRIVSDAAVNFLEDYAREFR